MTRILVSAVISGVFAVANLAAASEPISTGIPDAGVAAGGHDVTAYRKLPEDGQARRGSQRFTTQWKGAQWHFTSAADRDRFAANPTAFAPAFNGFCANALSLGEGLIRTSGQVWAIFDDKLYFFFAPRGLRRWRNGDWRTYQREAMAAWQQMTQ